MDTQQRHQPPNWEEAKPFFRRDGMLRDIQCDGSLEAWRSWLRALVAASWSLEYRVRGESVSPSLDFPRAAPDDEATVLRILLGAAGPQINTFFYDPDEVDADLAPEDFVAEEQWSELVKFLTLMGDVTGGEVRLSPEGDHRHPWLIYTPRQRVWTTIGDPADHIVDYWEPRV